MKTKLFDIIRIALFNRIEFDRTVFVLPYKGYYYWIINPAMTKFQILNTRNGEIKPFTSDVSNIIDKERKRILKSIEKYK